MAREVDPKILSEPATWASQLISKTYQTVLAFLPDLMHALILLILGLIGAWLTKLLILRFGRGLDRLMSTLDRGRVETGSRPKISVTGIAARGAFWIILILSFIGASEALGMQTLAKWLQGLLSYLPSLLISAAIMFIGYLISQGTRDLILKFSGVHDLQNGYLLAQVVAGLIIAFSLLLALEQLGLDASLLENILILSFAAFFGGAALAFGIGAADSIRNILASHYLRRLYQPGMTVRVSEVEGEILELTAVGVLFETDQGQTFIPARTFMEQVSIICEQEDDDGA